MKTEYRRTDKHRTTAKTALTQKSDRQGSKQVAVHYVVIAHDMTKNERKNCKTLVEDAKKQQEEDDSGDFIYRAKWNYRGNDIVRLRRN